MIPMGPNIGDRNRQWGKFDDATVRALIADDLDRGEQRMGRLETQIDAHIRELREHVDASMAELRKHFDDEMALTRKRYEEWQTWLQRALVGIILSGVVALAVYIITNRG